MSGPNQGIEGGNNNEQERQRQEEQLRDAETKSAQTAGLNEDQIGINAVSTAELQDPTNPKNYASGPSSQEVKDEEDPTLVAHASGQNTDSQKEQYDLVTSGAGKGLVAGTIFDLYCIQRERRMFREEQDRQNKLLIHASLNASIGLDNFVKAVKNLEDDVENATEEAKCLEHEVNALIDDLDQKKTETLELIEKVQEKIDNATDPTQIEQLTNLKDALENRVESLDNRTEAITEGLANNLTALSDAEQNLNKINTQINALPDGVEPSPEMAQELANATAEVNTLRTNIANLTDVTEFASEQHKFEQRIVEIAEGAIENPDTLQTVDTTAVKETSEQLPAMSSQTAALPALLAEAKNTLNKAMSNTDTEATAENTLDPVMFDGPAIAPTPSIIVQNPSIATNAESDAGQEQENWDASETLTLGTSEAEMLASQNIAKLVEGGQITTNNLDQALSGLDGVDREQIERSLQEQGIEILKPDESNPNPSSSPFVPTNAPDPEMANFPFLGAQAPANAIQVPEPTVGDAAPVSYVSFADSELDNYGPALAGQEPIATNAPDPGLAPNAFILAHNNTGPDTTQAAQPTATAPTNAAQQQQPGESALAARLREINQAEATNPGTSAPGNNENNPGGATPFS